VTLRGLRGIAAGVLLAVAVLALIPAVAGASTSAPTKPGSSPSQGGPDPDAGPTHGQPGDLVVLSGDVVVRKNETSGDVVVVHGSARVAGVVRGDVVVVEGPVDVAGVVHGDVVALDGDVGLVSGAHVTGDVTVAHGKLAVQVGALIDGSVRRGGLSFLSPSKLVTKLGFWIAISVSTLLLGLVLLLLAPRAGDAVARAGRDALGASIGWGAVAVLGLPVGGFMLLVSLVGLPFGLGLLLGLALLFSIGYAYAGLVLGRLLVRSSRHGGARRIGAFLAGWAILRAVGFVPVLGGITWFLAAWYGLGSATVAMWRARREPVPRLAPDRADPGFTSAAEVDHSHEDSSPENPAPERPAEVPPFTEPAH
jgi:hypothetical protein